MAETRNASPVLKECARFVKKEILPVALEADKTRDPGFAREVFEKSRGLDLPDLLVPEDLGGAGESPALAGSVLAEMAFACAGAASIFAFHYAALAALCLAHEKKARGLIRKTHGRPATVILPDPLADGPPALARENGRLVLSGNAPAVGSAHLAHALVVFAKSADGTAVLVLERDAPGLCVGEDLLLPGLCANPFATVIFDRVPVSPAAFLCPGSEAPALLGRVQELFLALIGAICLGVCRAAREQATEHAKNRYQFGDAIIRHSEIQRMLGQMMRDEFVSSAAVSKALAPDAPPRAGLLAKTQAADSAYRAALDGVQILGGYGYMHEYGMEKRLRDAKTLQLAGGSTPHLLTSCAAELTE